MINHSCHPKERNTKLVLSHDSVQREPGSPEECYTGYFAMVAGMPCNRPPTCLLGVPLHEVQPVALIAVQSMMCS